MLTEEEKSYCRALEALRKKDYLAADTELKRCGRYLAQSRGLRIIAEAVAMLVRLEREKKKLTKNETEIEEAVCHGEETVVCGQGEQEEAR